MPDMPIDHLYGRSVLQSYLRDRDLPFSHPTLIRYEKSGVIPQPKRRKDGNRDRVYSMEDIELVVQNIRNYVTGQ